MEAAVGRAMRLLEVHAFGSHCWPRQCVCCLTRLGSHDFSADACLLEVHGVRESLLVAGTCLLEAHANREPLLPAGGRPFEAHGVRKPLLTVAPKSQKFTFDWEERVLVAG